MVLFITITLLSLLFQLLSAVMALRLMRVSGVRYVWMLLATALVLMAVRRGIVIAQVIAGGALGLVDFVVEGSGLIISVFFVWGITAIGPLINDIVRDKDAYQRHQEELQQILDFIPAIIVYKDRDGRVLRANRAFAESRGLPVSVVIGRLTSDLFPADEAAKRLADDRAVMEQGAPTLNIIESFSTSEGMRWARTHKMPYIDSRGAITGIIAVAEDITELKQSEETLSRINRMLRLLNACNQEMVRATEVRVLLDAVCRVITAEGEFPRAWVVLDDEVGGDAIAVRCLEARAAVEYHTTESPVEAMRALDPPATCLALPLLARETPLGILHVQFAADAVNDADGRLFLEELSVDLSHALFTRRLLEEQQTATAALQLDEQRLQALLRLSEMTDSTLQEITDFALEEGVRLTQSTLGYLAFLSEDETVLTMHSWSRSAMAECAIVDKPIVYPVETTGLWGEAVRQRQPVITNDYTADNPGKRGYPAGHVTVLRHMNVPIFDGSRIVALIGVGNKTAPYDDSDVLQLQLLVSGMWRLLQHRKAEELLLTLNEELEERVRERTAQLEAANSELLRSNSELQQFAYVASHDLQEPLRMVVSYLQLLERRYTGQLDQDANDFIGFAVDGASRMQRLINDLLAYSRVGTRPITPAQLDATLPLAQAIANLRLTIEETGAIVTQDPLPYVWADEGQLIQLFQNLLANAIKFHRPGVLPVVHVSARVLEGLVEFRVADNGIGLDMQFADRIFGIFQRLHGKGDYPGTGIGLAVCKRIVERHGGAIRVESVPGAGTTFIFTLPVYGEVTHGTPGIGADRDLAHRR
jgi:PAS domain S-box-containing protein